MGRTPAGLRGGEPGESISRDEVLAHLDGRVAKWWLPDDVVFIDEVPKTSVGKFSKKDLRGRFEDYDPTDCSERRHGRTRRPWRCRFALRPRWILLHLLVLALIAAMIGLMFWQIDRLHEKQAVNAKVEQGANRPAAVADAEARVRCPRRRRHARFRQVGPPAPSIPTPRSSSPTAARARPAGGGDPVTALRWRTGGAGGHAAGASSAVDDESPADRPAARRPRAR